jgi:CTP:molybdopterin cytidylyltransferase MocA
MYFMIARANDNGRPTNQTLLRRLPENLLTSLFRGATTVRHKTDQVLFLAGDTPTAVTVSTMGYLRSRCAHREGTHSRLSRLGRNRW